MDFLGRMTQVVDYIEANIAGDIKMGEIEKIVCCGAYQFGRIFSYIVGVSFSEYIRRRRLSLAAAELREGGIKVIDAALKYGYESPDAFTRAFSSLHGITPREASIKGAKLRFYPRITFYISIRGDVDMEYRIEEIGAIICAGLVKNLGGWQKNMSAEHWTDKMGEYWEVWDNFLDGGMNEIIRDKFKLYRPPFYQIGLTRCKDGETILMIGAQTRDGESYPELELFEIPAGTWAVFTAKGTLNQNVHPIEALMARVYTEWLPSSGYEDIPGLTAEVYGPGDTQRDDYTCEFWIPVRKKG